VEENMRKILPFVVIGILILSGFGAVATYSDNENFESEKIDYKNIGNRENVYSHTILGEFGTATWGAYCKYAHGALKNIYAGQWHPFYYVSLVCNKNTHAYQRAVSELGLTGYPTVFFDGDYTKNVGAGSIPGAQAAYNSSIEECGEREVADVDIDLNVTWNGNAEMYIEVFVDNNEGSIYEGHLHVYVTEIFSSMGWYVTGGGLYTFPFLDYAFNQDISVSAGNTWQDSITWDGHDYNNGYGDDFSSITYGNIMIIGAVFDGDTNYVDDTTGYRVGDDDPPNTPSDPDPEDGANNVSLDADLSWTGGDPEGDIVFYDVYFEANDPNPDVKVADDINETWFDPGLLEYRTVYYWKIVARDDYYREIVGPVWQFTTVENIPPGAPTIDGPPTGKVGQSYDFIFSAVDPEGQDVFYYVEWGDGYVKDWDGPHVSGGDVIIAHTYYVQGNFTIRVKAKDVLGAESEWTEFPITMPKDKANYYSLFLSFLERFPLLQKLLQQLSFGL
jgi:hypothetical protein